MTGTSEFTVKGFVVWIVCAGFYLYEFLLRTITGTFQKQIMHDLKLSSLEFSVLSTTVFILFYGMMQIPVGLIVDQIGLKKSLLIGAIMCAATSIGFSCSESYIISMLCRMLMGIGASFGFICLLVSAYEWMPYQHRGFFIGLSAFIGTLGPMLGAGPLEAFVETNNIDWRSIFFCLGGFGIALSIPIWIFVENNHQKSNKYLILRRPEKTIRRLLGLFSRSQPLYIAFFSACIFFPVEYLSENEGRTFLVLKNCSPSFASYMISVCWLGYALGGSIMGLLSDFFERRKTFMIFSSFLGIFSAITIASSTNKPSIMGAFFLLGISASGQSIAFTLVAEQFNKKSAALAFGLSNEMISAVSAIIAPLMGWMLDCSQGNRKAVLHDYYLSFSVLTLLLLVSLLIALFLVIETYCKSSVDFTYLKVSKEK